MEELEGIIGVSAWSACDHDGSSGFAAVKRMKTTLVATMKQYAVMPAKQDEECQGKFLARMERKQTLMSEAPEDLQGRIFQEIRVLDERISAEEINCLAGVEAGDEGAVEGKEVYRSGGVDRYSCCWEWSHSDGSSWVSNVRDGG